MILHLFKLVNWEENGELKERQGVVFGKSFEDAVKTLDLYYDAIEEINYLAPVGDSGVYELDNSAYDCFCEIKENFIW